MWMGCVSGVVSTISQSSVAPTRGSSVMKMPCPILSGTEPGIGVLVPARTPFHSPLSSRSFSGRLATAAAQWRTARGVVRAGDSPPACCCWPRSRPPTSSSAGRSTWSRSWSRPCAAGPRCRAAGGWAGLGELDEARVEADPDRLAVAVDALVENAAKFTSEDDAIELSAPGARLPGRSVRHRHRPRDRARAAAADLRQAHPGGRRPEAGELRSGPGDRARDRRRPREFGAGAERGGQGSTLEVLLPRVPDPLSSGPCQTGDSTAFSSTS
jgi:hypothetical protein